jgi:BirA family transcriptional regulator, biotin operon repressor / biotin---[acetyl-CoA-carboxylase] ligase
LPANSFNLARLREELKPFRLHFFPRLRSTNDHAALLRKRGDLFAPAVVVAARQTAGRGRGANSWYSAPAGSITVTFVLPVNATLAPHHLPLAAGLAVRNAAAEISRNDRIQLKWPNDLVFPSAIHNPASPIQKLAGLLCERLDNVDLIGIGLNVNRPPRPLLPRNLRERIIYLQQIRARSAAPFDLTTVLITIARHLHTTLIRRSETPFPLLLREYDTHHALIGRSVTVISPHESPVSGKCFGLDDTGRLLLRNRGHVYRIIAGHVELTR